MYAFAESGRGDPESSTPRRPGASVARLGNSSKAPRLTRSERRAQRIALEQCARCGGTRDRRDRRECARCRATRRATDHTRASRTRRRAYQLARRAALILAGACLSCGLPNDDGDRALCAPCRTRRRVLAIRYRREVLVDRQRRRRQLEVCIFCGRDLCFPSARLCRRHLLAARRRGAAARRRATAIERLPEWQTASKRPMRSWGRSARATQDMGPGDAPTTTNGRVQRPL